MLLLITLAFDLTGQITGIVKDVNGDVLPFAAVYIKGTSNGTFSNEKGEYFLDLKKGRQTVVFSYLGYKPVEMVIDYKGKKIYKDITLSPDDVILQEVVIEADAEDPAYAIIRKAIKAAPGFRGKPANIEARIYQKLKIELLDVPEKIFGMKVAKSEEDKKILSELLDTAQNVLLVTETVSTLFRGENGKFKEIILSSKISGNKKGYANLSGIFSNLDFYKDFVVLGRKLVSPVSRNALLFYDYKLLGTFYDSNGNLINKIKVIPKRKYDPVFAGIIFITGDIWNIRGIDVTVTGKNTNIRFLDTINIKQDFKQLDDGSWALLSQYSTFTIGILGFKAKGYHVRNFVSYKLHRQYDKDFFDKIVYKIEKQANKRDSLYWDKIRPMPLSAKERKGYARMDSLETVTQSKEYLDSIDRVANRVSLLNLLTGYKHVNSYKHSYWQISSPLADIQYNPVQGYNVNLGFSYYKKFEAGKYFKTGIHSAYGFAGKQLLLYGKIDFLQNRKKKLQYTLEGGRRYLQPSGREIVTPSFNSFTAPVQGKNYIKLYEKKYVALTVQRRLKLNLTAKVNMGYGQRNPLVNHSNTGLQEGEQYPPNIFSDGENLKYKNKFDFSISLRYKPFAKYLETPFDYHELGSMSPVFEFYYQKALGLDDEFVDYDFVRGSVKGLLPAGLLGVTKYQGEAGMFPAHKNTDIIDDWYPGGNQMYLMTAKRFDNSFHLLPFYYRVGFEPYFIFRLHQYTQGMFAGKIPLLKLLKAEEVFSIDLLKVKGESVYVETGIGLEKIFGIVSVRYSWAFAGTDKVDNGFTFAFKYVLGSL